MNRLVASVVLLAIAAVYLNEYYFKLDSSRGVREYRGLRNEGADTIEYRQDPAETSENDPSLQDNVLFYENKIKSVPNGDYIENILKEWWGDYARLEVHHGYIQWLFPNRVQGLNSRAHALQLHELEVFRFSYLR